MRLIEPGLSRSILNPSNRNRTIPRQNYGKTDRSKATAYHILQRAFTYSSNDANLPLHNQRPFNGKRIEDDRFLNVLVVRMTGLVVTLPLAEVAGMVVDVV